MINMKNVEMRPDFIAERATSSFVFTPKKRIDSTTMTPKTRPARQSIVL